MTRLVDYFAVYGLDFDKTDDPLQGKIITKIPEQDWSDEPFIQGLDLFCQPAGWSILAEQSPPKYFVSVLTDEKGFRHYCAVLSFSEPITEENLKKINKSKDDESSASPDDSTISINISNDVSPPRSPSVEDIDDSIYQVDGEKSDQSSTSNKPNDNKRYSTKCIVVISRHQNFQVLKNCVGLIYTAYIENLSVSMEHIIANLLTVIVAPTGSSSVRFSIGAADKQVIQPPQCEELPVTGSTVSVLLKQLGILNVLNILSAVLVDQKLLFYSCSFSRLTDTCLALTALMFPFKYSYPFIPILPKKLLEMTSSPTPFLIGVHSCLKEEIDDLLDVITVDLDGGVISIPECVTIPMIPEPFYSRVVKALTKVLCPDLMVADYAYPPEQLKYLEPERLDKEIRAIFLRTFSQILMGYRTCLQVVRIHPNPIIRFQKDMFMTLRGFDKLKAMHSNSMEFISKLLDSQAFSSFITDHGTPFRKLSIFDHTVAEMPEQVLKELGDMNKILRHTKDIAYDLYRNEYPNHTQFTQKVPKPSESAHMRENQKPFPTISPTAVQTFMCEKPAVVNEMRRYTPALRKMKKVPKGSQAGFSSHRESSFTTSNRRLEVLRNCVQFIFESKTLEIKKIFHAVLRALKSRAIRRALTVELAVYSKSKPQLDTQQFDYIVRLINSALDDSSGEPDEYLIASDLLPVVSTFYRKLSLHVVQNLYTVVQEHPVWSSQGFWEFSFFSEIQSQICDLYQLLKHKKKSPKNQVQKSNSMEELLEKHRNHKQDNSIPMEIAALEIQEALDKTDSERSELEQSEEGVIVGQTMHTAQRMIFMLVPMSGVIHGTRVKYLKNPMKLNFALDEASSNSFVASSLADSMNEDSEEDEPQDGGNMLALVTKFVSRFIDRACTEAGISAPHAKSLSSKIQPMVSMQFESLQDVFVESKRLPPIKKAKLLEPKLLTGEVLVLEEPLRAFLATDGRLVASGGFLGGPALLPAEGAVFLTNYRLIFIGTPNDALASEQVVIRSFPTSALYKVKSFHRNEHPRIEEIDSNLHHGVIIRSTTFQLLVLAFYQDEVGEEKRSLFQTQINNLRYPSTIADVFAIQQSSTTAYNPVFKSGNRGSGGKGRKSEGSVQSIDTQKKSGPKTFMRQAKRKAGSTLGKQRFSRLINDNKAKTIYMPALTERSPQMKRHSEIGGSSPELNEAMTKTLSDKSTMDRLHQRACKDDYIRTGLINVNNAQFKISSANQMFSVCRSYPAYIVIPKQSTDESLRSIAHCHHQNRFPAVVWMHREMKSVLLRSAGIRSRTVAAIFKHGQINHHQLSDEGTLGSSAEEERFLMSVLSSALASKPSNLPRPESTLFTGEEQNQDLPEDSDPQKPPMQRGNNGFSTSLRVPPSQQASNKTGKKWGTITRTGGRSANEHLALENRLSRNIHNGNGTLTPGTYHSVVHKAQLYIFGDKSLLKNMRHEQQGMIEFVPVEAPEPKHVRNSFKSFLKACLPADTPPESQQNEQILDDVQLYRKNVEESGWLQQISTLLGVSGAIVDLMDVHGASTMVAFEDGWDITCQLSSLSQIMMDPHYRTIIGFQTLIQKEWLSFGHRFSHRSLFNPNISSGYTPVFLQFLDAVYQILYQFPMSFEFNETYLNTIAYHFSSNRFTTFLLDSDYERLEAGILFGKENKNKSNQPILSLWKYLELAHARSPLFLNPLYGSANLCEAVLRPASLICRLRIWPFYSREALGEGPIYDGLLGELSTGAAVEQDAEAVEASTARRVVNSCYDNIQEVQPDSIKALLQRIQHLNSDLGIVQESWRDTWRAACDASPKRKRISEKTQEARRQMKSLHKLSTVELIARRSFIRDDSDNISMASMDAGTLRSGINQDFDTASLYEQMATTATEVRTYEGYLWKRGAMMKGWKQRFFVLDTTKHQLRQYESNVDKSCKSIVDLKEVESVSLVEHLSSAPKFATAQSIIELTTNKRSFHFIAENKDTANTWIENIQSALQG